MFVVYIKVFFITVNCWMQNTLISKKKTLNRSVSTVVIDSINGLNNVEIRTNDAHRKAASEVVAPVALL